MSILDTSKYNKVGRNKYAFIEYPSAKIYKKPTGKSWYNHLLFGDYVTILNKNIKNGRVYARGRNSNGWVNVTDLRKDRLLEVNFVDIGQGDGCHVVTPDDKHILIDAGKTDNMIRYLTWRFNLNRFKSGFSFPLDILISHSDSDHYLGFSHVFNDKRLRVNKVYHNGLVERPGKQQLGEEESGFITGLVNNTAEMKAIITKPENLKGSGSLYCKTLKRALNNNNDIEFIGLSIDNEYLGEFTNQNIVNNKELSFKILAPIKSKVNDKKGLKTINDLGKDKNGHSVVLRLQYGKAKILLGGDVNEEFGRIIYDYYKTRNSLIDLQVDIAKACHHGSHHFDYKFIQAINATGTIISSGDDESYSHPRPDAIGTFGKCGYGDRPLVYSTELARSNKEFTKTVLVSLTNKINRIEEIKKQIKSETDENAKAILFEKLNKLNKEANSFLTKYGMVNLRTDGEKMIIAQKLERPSSFSKWDIQKLEYSVQNKRFELMLK